LDEVAHEELHVCFFVEEGRRRWGAGGGIGGGGGDVREEDGFGFGLGLGGVGWEGVDGCWAGWGSGHRGRVRDDLSGCGCGCVWRWWWW